MGTKWTEKKINGIILLLVAGVPAVNSNVFVNHIDAVGRIGEI